jgi:phenylacetate-CoA ligase
MLVVRGVNVFPSQVETVLLGLDGLRPHYLILVDREKGAMDELEVWIEVSPEVFTDEFGRLADLQALAEREMDEMLGIHARVKLVEPGRIERSTGKSKRVVDRREL